MWWLKPILALISVLVCLLLAEAFMRVAFDPVDFLKPTLIDDPVMGHRIAPGSGGHDDWGFRNKEVPPRVDVVAIGDSQTYGLSALASNSWPAWVERLSGLRVYNMALGGWGPIQYELLLKEKAVELAPSVVVLGLYFGNDFFDSYRVVYGLDHWAELRTEGRDDLLKPYLSVERDRGFGVIAKVRIWLGHHSILYRLVANTFGQLAGRIELRLKGADPEIVHFEEDGFETGFTPRMRLEAIDRNRPDIEEGFRQTLAALARMVDFSREQGIDLVVLLIPTKETVFGDRLSARSDLPQREEIESLLVAEQGAREEVTRFLQARGVTVVDPLPMLRQASKQAPIYPSNEDGHPISSGYRIIAEAVADALRVSGP